MKGAAVGAGKPGGFVRDGVVFTASRDLQAKGEVSAASALLAAHFVSHPGASEAALELVRIHLAAGHVLQALDVLDTLPVSAAGQGLRLRLGMEKIHAHMLQTFDVGEAAKSADHIWHAADQSRIEPAELADADRTRSRIILEAATYREVPAGRADEALNDLAVAASLLLEAGWTDEGLAAALELACWQCRGNPVSSAHLSFAGDAARRGRTDFTAAAYLREADRMLGLSAPVAGIQAHIDEASRLYEKVGNDLGLIDAAYAAARLRTRRLNGSISELEDVLSAYERYGLPARNLAVTLNLAAAARRSGDFEAARRFREQADAIAAAAGLTMPRAVARLPEIEDFIGAEAAPKAILLGNDALAQSLPRLLRAGIEASLARAHALAGESAEARRHLGRALADYDAVDAVAEASTVVAQMVAAALPMADESFLLHFIDVLRVFATRDHDRGDAKSASLKHQLRAQSALRLQRLQPRSQFLNEAESAIGDAVAEAETLDEGQRPRSFGEIAKISGQIAVLSNDLSRAERTYRNAIDLFDNAGLTLEAAHCRLIVGGMRLRTYHDAIRRNDIAATAQHFEEAEEAFNAAHSGFDEQGFNTESARALRLLAQLYVAASETVDQKAASRLRLRAIACVEDAEKALDASRIRTMSEPYATQLSARKAIAQESRQLYAVAAQGDGGVEKAVERLWGWHQKSRARAIMDSLPGSIDRAGNLVSPGAGDAMRHAIAVDRALSAQAADARATKRAAIHERQARHRRGMSGHPAFRDYLEQRAGTEPHLDSIRALIEHTGGRRLALVDFVNTDGRIGIMVTTREGVKPIAWLRAEAYAVRRLAEEWCDLPNLRRKISAGREALKPLDAFVAPLADLTAPGDELILCPAGPLAHFPLHALNVEGAPLLRRNAIAFAPSIAMWRAAVMRPRATQARPNSVVADPLSDCPGCRITGEKLAMRLSTAPVLGRSATRDRALPVMSDAHIFHFHGQSIVDAQHTARSRLVFSDGAISAADIAGMHITADLVVLGMRQAAQPERSGTEPEGLATALLMAGARAVIAPLWPNEDADAGHFFEPFYQNLFASPGLPASEVLRRTQLQLMAAPAFASPYHWANYVLYGDGAV